MDQIQSYSDQASLSFCGPEGSDCSSGHRASNEAHPQACATTSLTLVRNGLTFARPNDEVPSVWGEALEQLTQELGIDARWVPSGSPTTLFQRARRAVGAESELKAPVFAPWRVTSPTLFQTGQAREVATGAKWMASYLFDFGPACSAKSGSIDVALMSPCPEVCVSDDAYVGSLPRLSVLADMMRAAALEGRRNLAVVVRESARATLATRLLGFDLSLNEMSLDVEFVSIEEAAVDIQSGCFDWDAVIVMPDLRGIMFAMLAQHAGVTGPWPMLWFDQGQGLRLVTREALVGAGRPSQLDATVLIQALALLAGHSGHQYAARRFYGSWAAVRDSGFVTALRGSSAPCVNNCVNKIDEAAFVDQATRDLCSQTRPLPSWKGLVCAESEARKDEAPVRLSLVT